MALMEKLPPQCYNGHIYVADLQQAFEQEVNKAKAARDDLLLQARPATSSWGLRNYEAELAIETDLRKSFADRLAFWRAKRRARGTTTEALVKSMAEAAFGGEVNVYVFPDKFLVEIESIGSTYANVEDFLRLIDEIFPAHLGFLYRWVLAATSNIYAGIINQDSAEETVTLINMVDDPSPQYKHIYAGMVYHEVTHETTYITLSEEGGAA